MKIQMPFNSRVHIRLFERVETPASECHRVFDVLGLEDADGNVDAVTGGYASRFHKTRPVSEIKADVDKATKKEDTPQQKAEEVPTDDNDDVEDDGSVRG